MGRKIFCFLFFEVMFLANCGGQSGLGWSDKFKVLFPNDTGHPLWSWNESWTDVNSWQPFSDWSSNFPTSTSNPGVYSYPEDLGYIYFQDFYGNFYTVHVFSSNQLTRGPGAKEVEKLQEMVIVGESCADNGCFFYDTWIYSSNINSWRLVRSHHKPFPVSYRVFATICSYIVLIGGQIKEYFLYTYKHDVWIFDTQQEQWLEVEQKNELAYNPGTDLSSVAAVQIADDSTPCSCKESVLLLIPTLYRKSAIQLSCLNDTQLYMWKRVTFTTKEKDEVYPGRVWSNSEVASSLSTTIYVMDSVGLWQYTTGNNTWRVMKNLGDWKAVQKECEYGKSVLIADVYMRFSFDANTVCLYPLTRQQWVIKYHLTVADSSFMPWPFVCNNRVFQFDFQLPSSSPVRIMELMPQVKFTWQPRRDPEISPLPSILPICDILGDHMYCVRPVPPIQTEFWKLSLNDMRWQKLIPFSPLSFTGTRNSHYAAATRAGNSSFVVCQSISNGNETIVGVTAYSALTKNWVRFRWYQKPEEQPVGRVSHTVVALNGTSLLMFGGWNHSLVQASATDIRLRQEFHSILNDTWILSVSSSESKNHSIYWTLINTTISPPARIRHSMVFIQDKVFLYGGADQHEQCINDLWQFNVATAEWNEVTTIGKGPELATSLENWCHSTATAVGGHLIVVIRHPNETIDGLQIWMFIPHSARWTFLSQAKLYGTTWNYFMFYWRRRLVIYDSSKPNLWISLLGCPPGFRSANISDVNSPCQQCPYGSYSLKGASECEDCPSGLTTLQPESTDVSQCSVCTDGYCQYGRCVTVQVEGILQPSCQCSVGFIGSRCQYPTYYLTTLGVIILTVLAVVGVAVPHRLWKKKRRREEALDNHVRQFNSVWQIKEDEIVRRDRVGRGGYGEVYRAEYRDMTVAMKILTLPADESMQDDFEREIKFMQTIRHPNIVMFLGAGRLDDNESPFIVAEFMHRGSVRDLLDNKSQQLDFHMIKKIAVDVAQGMDFLHNLVPPRIHCDLKSDNLLISQSWIVKVADFGLGRQLIAQRNTTSVKRSNRRRRMRSEILTLPLIQDGDELSQQAVGAARWRAPEISRHNLEQLSTSADVYR